MRVAELWRYPVKSMAGERLEAAEVRFDGLRGDRVVHVRDARGVVTSRSRPSLLGYKATLGPDGEPLIDGRPWTSVELPGLRLARDDTPERFDILPLLVATDGAIAAFGHDGRRLRPNLVIGGVEGLAERDWPGRRLRIGEVLIGVDSLRGRCVMTTYDPDTLAQDAGVLRRIVQQFGGEIALNCWVEHPGSVALGDPVQLL